MTAGRRASVSALASGAAPGPRRVPGIAARRGTPVADGRARSTSRKRRRATPRDVRGFTLLEVMVALAVIATAFTALLGLHVRNLKLAARDQAYTQALLLARSMISEVELGPYLDVGISQGDFEGRWPGRYPGFRWERTVSDFGIFDVREITVRVIPNGDESASSEMTVFVRPKNS